MVNMLSTEEKRRIAGRARTLQERLDAPTEAAEASNDFGESLDEHLDDWLEYVADGDPEAFRKRLDYEDLDLTECKRRIATNEWPADRPLPDWVERLDDLLEFVREEGSPGLDFQPDREYEFQDALAPLAEYALEQVEETPPEYVSDSAVNDLTEWLVRRLRVACSHTLFIEFKTHIANDDPDLVFDDETEIEAGSTAYYDEFTENMVDGGLKPFFLEYSFLARIVVTTIRQWVSRVEAFYGHVSNDWPELRDTFGDGADLREIAGIWVVGDPHQDGREVFGITFDSGAKAAYKPRNAGIVVGFFELLEWINENGTLPELRTLDFVHRNDYAWMEWVQPAECSTEDEVVTYYRRAGMLMCLFYALNATDMHLENIIAEGGQPVPVDLETLAEPMVDPSKREINESVKVVADTVVRTGVVPRYLPSDDVGDMGGFSAQQGEIDREIQQFTNTNTDRMELEERPIPNHEGRNLPKYDGEVIEPRENTDQLLRGFRDMYRFVLDNKQAVLGEDGPIEGFVDRQSRVRVLYRGTSVYGNIRKSMGTPSFHRTGLPFGIRTEALARVVVAGDVDREVWSIYEAERDVLRRFNTPRFNAKIDSTDIYDLDEVTIEEFFEEKPIDQIRDRIRSFDDSDLGEQLEYIRWGYGDYRSAHEGTDAADVSEFASETPDEFDRLAGDAARRIFDRVDANSETEDGDRTWVLREVGPDGGVNVHPIEDRLYDGRIGIGVFAAGLARAFGDERYREFADETAAPILAAIEDGEFENDPSSEWQPPRPVGGGAGLGSIVYGLTKMGELLNDRRYTEAAERVCSSISPARISDDDQYDVLHGSAGAILGLLALYDATGDGEALDRATAAGEHLLESRGEFDGVAAWRPTDFGQPLCGFSHGVAGIAYALARLAAATDDSRFERAALESIEYERRRYDEQVENWPDLREQSSSEWMDAWCHGRTGIGLARLGTYDADPTSEVRRDAERAVRGVDPSTLSSVDHVCCGNFGRVELLLRAGRTLDEPAYRADAERLAAASLARAESEGRFATHWQTDHWHNPSFFDGEAGIGYSLLRFVDDSLPCVLLWE